MSTIDEIVIPAKLIRRTSKKSNRYYHYELLKDKCTKYLAVYRCLENGTIETFQKKQFKTKNKEKGQPSKYERV